MVVDNVKLCLRIFRRRPRLFHRAIVSRMKVVWWQADIKPTHANGLPLKSGWMKYSGGIMCE